LNYFSVFSGIETASVAWEKLGFSAVGFSEIDPFSSAVLKYHFPKIKNYGDINNFKEWKIGQSINIMVGGSPCQSFSIAGNRQGVKDDRGFLMFTYGNLVQHFKPDWIVWENVPGVLSNNRGKDFREFLFMLDEFGYGLAWRVLDAQYFGVPQRRRRIFVIGYFGDIRRSAAVLFDFGGSKGDIKAVGPRGGASERIRECIKVYNSHPADSRIKNSGGIINTITGRWGTGGNNTPIVFNRSHNTKYTKADKAATLLGEYHDRNYLNLAFYNNQIRKITPCEAERLQGFPDNWTKVPYRNKNAEKCPDGLRYKAIGNSMAVPVMRWIGERILLTEKIFQGVSNENH
jgi:DNA (cytosine-5)-methyltransferase 1